MYQIVNSAAVSLCVCLSRRRVGDRFLFGMFLCLSFLFQPPPLFLRRQRRFLVSAAASSEKPRGGYPPWCLSVCLYLPRCCYVDRLLQNVRCSTSGVSPISVSVSRPFRSAASAAVALASLKTVCLFLCCLSLSLTTPLATPPLSVSLLPRTRGLVTTEETQRETLSPLLRRCSSTGTS